jgi:hypothetical protein
MIGNTGKQHAPAPIDLKESVVHRYPTACLGRASLKQMDYLDWVLTRPRVAFNTPEQEAEAANQSESHSGTYAAANMHFALTLSSFQYQLFWVLSSS